MSILIKAAFLCFVGLWTNNLWSDTLSISANPGSMTINTATAGSQPNSVTNTSTNYNVSTTIVVRKITGAINTNMPANVTLRLSLAAPAGATSTGAVSMSTVSQNLVTSIPRFTTATSLTITYQLSATVAAAQISNATKTLTLTLQ